jgi:hypothetical protein
VSKISLGDRNHHFRKGTDGSNSHGSSSINSNAIGGSGSGSGSGVGNSSVLVAPTMTLAPASTISRTSQHRQQRARKAANKSIAPHHTLHSESKTQQYDANADATAPISIAAAYSAMQKGMCQRQQATTGVGDAHSMVHTHCIEIEVAQQLVMHEAHHARFWAPSCAPYSRGHAVVLLEECIANNSAIARQKRAGVYRSTSSDMASQVSSTIATSNNNNPNNNDNDDHNNNNNNNNNTKQQAKVACGCRYEYEAVAFHNSLHPKQCKWMSWLLYVCENPPDATRVRTNRY